MPLSVHTSRAPTNVEETWRRHGAAVSALAFVLFDDADVAESVVMQAFLDACTPADIAVPSASRHDLARYVYVLYARRCALSDDPPRVRSWPGSGRWSSGVAVVRRLSQPQRTAIALGLFGEHTYREIALLMELPAPEVAELMRSGLLAAAS
jgi:hypothetical protein